MTTSKKKNNPVANEAQDIDTVNIDMEVRGIRVKIEGIPSDITDASFEVMALFEEGKPVNAFLKLIGAQNRAVLAARGLSFNDIQQVMEEWQRLIGVGED